MKNVAILILGVMVSQFSFAQEAAKKDTEFRFGIKGAANIAWVTAGSKNIEGAGTSLGWAYGIMGDYYFQPSYAVSTELLISQINGGFVLADSQQFIQDTSFGKTAGLTYQYTNQYLEIPISLKFRTKEIGNMTYWANFGFSPGLLMQAKASISGVVPPDILANDPNDFRVNDDEGDAFETDNFDDQVFLLRFPLIVGGGIEYSLAGNTSLYTGVRFTNSFTDMLVKDKNTIAKNNYFSINLGVFF